VSGPAAVSEAGLLWLDCVHLMIVDRRSR